jgi:polyphosphate glucokinase
MNILAVDVGGTHVKVMATGQTVERKVVSGPTMTAADMVDAVKKMTADWTYDAVSIGYPGPVAHGAPVKEPANLGPGWVGFDFAAAFGCPVKIINDAAMQALGSYEGGRMLFLGLGTGLGSAMVVDGRVEPLELAHLPYKDKLTYEDLVGLRGLERLGKKKWRRQVQAVIADLSAALAPDYVVIGGGNSKQLDQLPANVRLGDNANAFRGGFALWSARAGVAVFAPPAVRVAGERRVVDSSDALFQAAASEFFLRAIDAVNTTGRFTVALSGGSTPRGLYRLLATDPAWRDQLPWQNMHFFWGDERHVPPEHADSNFRMANEALLSVAPVPAANVHRMHGEAANAADAAREYEDELHEAFGLKAGEVPRFDLILLGLGPEGHTASLFPGTRALTENQRLVVSNWVGKLFADRITLTPPVLNNAACVMFIVSGPDKATALKGILEGPYEPDQLPAQLVNPTNGRLVWLLDRAAAQELGVIGS